MSHRAAILFLLITLCVAGMPLQTTATRSINASTQDPPLTISTTTVNQPGGGMITNLTGRYQNGSRIVNLRALSVKTVNASGIITGGPVPPPPSGPNGPTPEEAYEREPGFYSESEMSKPDGTILSQTVYEYEQPTGRNMVYMTLDGVTFSFDLNAQEVGPVSDDDLDKVNSWLDSDDGLLVRQVGVAMVQQGQQEPANEALLTYYLVAKTVGADSSQAALPISEERGTTLRAHHASTRRNTSAASFRNACPLSASFVSKGASLKAFVPSILQCSGCCGPGCYVIPNRWGVPICGGLCAAHDQCVGEHGNRRLARQCLHLIPAAIGYIVLRW